MINQKLFPQMQCAKIQRIISYDIIHIKYKKYKYIMNHPIHEYPNVNHFYEHYSLQITLQKEKILFQIKPFKPNQQHFQSSFSFTNFPPSIQGSFGKIQTIFKFFKKKENFFVNAMAGKISFNFGKTTGQKNSIFEPVCLKLKSIGTNTNQDKIQELRQEVEQMREMLESVVLRQSNQNGHKSQNGNIKMNVLPSIKFINLMIDKLKEINEKKSKSYQQKVARLENQVELNSEEIAKLKKVLGEVLKRNSTQTEGKKGSLDSNLDLQQVEKKDEELRSPIIRTEEKEQPKYAIIQPSMITSEEEVKEQVLKSELQPEEEKPKTEKPMEEQKRQKKKLNQTIPFANLNKFSKSVLKSKIKKSLGSAAANDFQRLSSQKQKTMKEIATQVKEFKKNQHRRAKNENYKQRYQNLQSKAKIENLLLTKPKQSQKQIGDKNEEKQVNFPNGEYYKGEIKDQLMHGRGMYFWKNGDKYEGHFRQGLRSGQGVLIYSDGSTYNGEWQKDKKSGTGIFLWNDKEYYEGEWKNGRINGKGKFVYKSGNVYEGQFLNGKKDGYGIFVWKSGNEYEGYWKDDERHGKGVYYKKNGNWQEREYEEGQKKKISSYFGGKKRKDQNKDEFEIKN